MSRPMSAFVPGQFISITIDDTTLNVMVRSVEIAHSTTMSHARPAALDDMIECSRVDALERRADIRDTMLVDMRDRLDALENARAWIDTQEVKARMDNHNERLDVLERRIAGQIDSASVYRRLNRIESALILPILTTKPKD